MQDRGYTHVTLEYEGSGDSGDCYYAEGFKDDEYKDAVANTKYGTVGEQLGQYHSENSIDNKVILHTYKGIVYAKTNGQKKYLDAVNNHDITFAIGPLPISIFDSRTIPFA